MIVCAALVHRTKLELAQEIIRHARCSGVRFEWVGYGMGAYGNSLELLESLHSQGETFLADVSSWDYRPVMYRAVHKTDALVGGEIGTGLESAFAKKGDQSVDVARQWNGRLGKQDNCQVGVFGALGRGDRVSLIDARLYLPKEWTDDPHRYERADVPRAEQRRHVKSLGSVVDDPSAAGKVAARAELLPAGSPRNDPGFAYNTARPPPSMNQPSTYSRSLARHGGSSYIRTRTIFGRCASNISLIGRNAPASTPRCR